MSLMASASESKGSFVQVSPGMHLAMCYKIVDLGTQKSEYLGEVKHLPKVMFQFEVHGDNEQGEPMITPKGEPLTISKNFTLSLAEKATLRRDLQTWRGKEFTAAELKGFELKNVLSKWCMLSVVHSTVGDKTYANIQAIMPIPDIVKKAGLPTPHNESSLYSIQDNDHDALNSFSTYIQDKIKASPEWQSLNRAPKENKSVTPPHPMDDLESDIPF